MSTKQIIRKIVFVVFTLAGCCGLVVLLVAAIGRKNHELCKDYTIAFHGDQKNLFVGEEDIKTLLLAAANGKVKGAPVTAFNLRKLEQQIKQNVWIQDADLYFDNNEVLHVSVTEKTPVARIFTAAGKSFYIDSTMKQMPLSLLRSAKVPVFTNFPDKYPMSTKDSVLLAGVKKTAMFISSDPFWMAQTQQIDITPQREFEMVPTIGNHIVKLGRSDDIDKKFHRLMIFYQQVLSKTGFDRYKIIDVQFAGQVIATKEKISKIDSIQLRKNVQKLLQESRQIQRDTVAAHLTGASGDTILATTETDPNAIDPEQHNPTPAKKATTAKPKLISEKKKGRQPKAVLPAKQD